MNTAVQSESLHRFASRARRLYSLPIVAVRVIELACQPELDSLAVQDCIATDPVLVSKILRLANSSLFGLSQQVTSLGQALTLLGAKTVRVLVLGFSLPLELLTGVECQILSRFWRKAVIKSVTAREISQMVWRQSGDEAFLAGLLQDIGMLALIQDLGYSYVEFLNRISGDEDRLAKMEISMLGFAHRQLSSEMLHQWGLPAVVSRAVSQDPDPPSRGEGDEHVVDLAQILKVSDRIAEFLLQGRALLLDEVLEMGCGGRGPSYEQLEQLMGLLESGVPQMLEVLSNDPVAPADYRGMLLKAHALLTMAANPANCDSADEASLLRDLCDEACDLSEAVRRFLGRDAHGYDIMPVPPLAGPALASRPPVSTASDGPVSDGLVAAIQSAANRCRQGRRPLSLLLAEIDHAESLGTDRSDSAVRPWVHRLGAAIREIIGEDGVLLELPPARLAIVLEGYERQQAVTLSRQLLRAVSHWSAERAPVPFSLSIGLASVAMPSRNVPIRELVEAAERCLHAVQYSHGDGVKSIDIY